MNGFSVLFVKHLVMLILNIRLTISNSSNAYELTKLQVSVVARMIFTGITASMFIGIISLFPISYAIEDNDNDDSSIKVSFAEIKPTIDGKFTSDAEWMDANVINFNSNEHEFYLLTKQNRDFVYMMFDGVDFKTDPKSDDLSVGYQIVLCFDGDNDKSSKRGLGDFCHNSIIYHEFGKNTRGQNAPIKFDLDGQSSHLDLVGDFKAGWNYGGQNDPFEESNHLTFEIQVPRILFESLGDVGFTFQMYTDSSVTDVIQLVDGVSWPLDAEKKIPSTWATLILPEIKCPENLNLIFKASDDSPVCVKESSVDKLLQRGYSVTVYAPNPLSKSLDEFTISDILKETIREKVDNGTHESLFVGIIDHDGTEQYYYGNIAKDEKPIDEDTLFEIGSVSKVFTSLILADMVIHDEVRLDDSIDKFLPENINTPSFNGEKITLLDLSTHTSGLPVMPNYPPNPDLDKKYEYNKDGIYEYLSDFVIHREIGSQFEYSNTGGSLLGHILSLHEEKSFEATLKERVLDKLGMSSTCINQCNDLRDRFAKPHSLGEQVDEVNLPDELAGAGAIRSSGKDMLAFLSYAMDLEHSELQPAFALTQTANHKIDEIQSIGLGWLMIDNGERNILFHNGSTKGFASFVGFDSDTNRGVVVLTNSQVIVNDIGLDILDFSFEE